MPKKEKSSHQFIEWITVSTKGQIAIPAIIRKKLNIKPSDRFMIIMRKDQDGINLIKEEAMNAAFKKFST